MRKTLTAVIICVIIAICFAGCNGIKESKNPESTALSVSTEADAASDDTDEHINNDITADCKQPANAEQAEIHSKEDLPMANSFHISIICPIIYFHL